MNRSIRRRIGRRIARKSVLRNTWTIFVHADGRATAHQSSPTPAERRRLRRATRIFVTTSPDDRAWMEPGRIRMETPLTFTFLP